MATPPPVSELEFLKLSGNHLELARKLSTLAFDAPQLVEYAKHVSQAWFRLAEAHLAEAKTMNLAAAPRAAYSRAYYAVYNASKAARYIREGFVSLKGDDHAKATDLPGDFPDVANWGMKIAELYEHRLRADYDNWSATGGSFTLGAAQAISRAENFVDETRGYLTSKCGMTL